MNPDFASFERLLAGMVRSGASDLFLSEGKSPAYRIDGALRPADDAATPRSMVESILAATLQPAQRDEFERNGETNTALSLPQVGRFRLNIHLQRGLTGIVVRRVPAGALTFEELGLPAELRAWSELRLSLIHI